MEFPKAELLSKVLLAGCPVIESKTISANADDADTCKSNPRTSKALLVFIGCLALNVGRAPQAAEVEVFYYGDEIRSPTITATLIALFLSPAI